MQVARLILPAVSILSFSACSADPPQSFEPRPPQVQGRTTSTALKLSAAQKASIGKKIWQNESGGKVSGLTAWNKGEEFPSMGIGHFIWYPKGFNGRWTESWPEFVKFAVARGHNVPAVGRQADCPWPNKASFTRDFNGVQLTGLRNWLKANIAVQTDFIAYKSRAALPAMLASAPVAQRARIKRNYDKVASTANGVYALVDYVNFKGDGTNHKETYAEQGWGLKWVLMEMRNVSSGQAAAREFAAAAKRRLDLRIKNSPKARGEGRWKAGWHNRCDTYAKPL